MTQFFGISTISTTSKITSAERSGKEFGLDRISLALFSAGKLPEVIDSLLFLAFLLVFIRIKGRKSLHRSETLGSSKRHVYSLRIPRPGPPLIFSYLPYTFVQTTASLMCKAWCQSAYNKTLIKYAGREDFSIINIRDSSKEAADNFLQAMKWRPHLFHSIDLCGATTTWKTFCEIAHNCTELNILNAARAKAKFLNTH